MNHSETGIVLGSEAQFALFTRRERHRLAEAGGRSPFAGDRSFQCAVNALRGQIVHSGIDREPGLRFDERQIRVYKGVAERHAAGRMQVDGLPDAGIAVGNKADALAGVLLRVLLQIGGRGGVGLLRDK